MVARRQNASRGVAHVLVIAVCAAVAALGATNAFAADAPFDAAVCDAFKWIPTAFDYRSPSSRASVNDVNRNHFNENVRNLVRGQSSTYAIDDLAFIFEASPNHAPALQVLARYILNGGKPYQHAPLECFFVQAMKFAPDDALVRQIYGSYLHKAGRSEEGLVRFVQAVEIAPDSAETHYNIGLVYLDVKDYERAMHHAGIAYSLGSQLPGLRRRLQQVGAWRDPAPTAPPQP